MTMIGSLIRFGRRHLHTIVSREIIKPSSPTPSHLKTYNLSLFDQTGVTGTYLPFVTFYASNTSIASNSHDKTLDLKKSLSQTLTKYYPFAGRFPKIAPAYIDCTDDGAEFLEASIDSTLSDFLQNSKHEDLHQFFPFRRVWNHDGGQGDKVVPLEVQVNHFECGGVAVAVSLSHKIADGPSIMHFINDWAKVTRFSSSEENRELPINPHFASNPSVNVNFNGFTLVEGHDCVTRSFMFPNSKIKDLKNKVIAMTAESEEPITNPSRVEVLNWLLYKSAVAAARTSSKSKFFKPTSTGFIINTRNKMMEKLPFNRIGNHFVIMKIYTNNETELKPEVFINDIKKQKIKIQNLRNINAAFDLVPNMTPETVIKEQSVLDSTYICSSVCNYPAYEIDFGWGKPVNAIWAGNMKRNSFIMMDAPNGDGIVALVCLGKEDMANVERDPELLSFC